MKITEFQKILQKKDIDFALFLNIDENKRDKNIFYFCNVDPEYCCLVIHNRKKPFLIVGKLDEEKVKRESRIKEIHLLGNKLFESIKSKIKSAKTIGVNFSKFTIMEEKALRKAFKEIKLADISKDLINLRAQKTDDEIKNIRKACMITDKIFSKIIKDFKFKTEKEIADFIEDECKKNNCEIAFKTIVASGPNSSMPHYNKNDSKLKKGFCVIDFGIRYNGYNSDMTRTIYIGKPSDKERYEYYKVLGVQEEAIKQIKAGIDFRKIDNSVRKTLGKNFIHALGHGIGIDVHDKLSSDKKNAILIENMVLAVEPGIYYPCKFGIRIEDDVLITKNGPEVLTKSKKELIVVNQ